MRVVSGVISGVESESRKNQNVSISSINSAYNSVAYIMLMIQGKPDYWSWKQKRKNKPITKYVPILLLPTLTIWISLDHKGNVSDGVVSGIRTLLRDQKLYVFDYDSDSDATGNQPLLTEL